MTDPPLDHPDYRSTALRHPKRPLQPLVPTQTELTGPVLGHERVGELDHDLTRQHAGEPLGERIIVHGRVIEEDGRPVPDTLIELWQANAAGRYRHVIDRHDAPLDPNFTGVGRTMTDGEGRSGWSRRCTSPATRCSARTRSSTRCATSERASG
jgi:protocatechuate 3,4-dioxygenase beta subunit